jgi:translation initiation factor 1
VKDSRILYSSDGSHLKLCQRCLKDPCRCAPAKPVVPQEHTLKIRRELAGRNGKPVTVIFQLPSDETFNKSLASQLKTACGSGGTYKEGTIEIQGDHRPKVQTYLEKMGFKVKLAGG